VASYNSPMEVANREKVWRISVLAVAIVSLVISALAFYGIKRLQANSKPKVHYIREVNKFKVESKPALPQPPAK